MKWKPSPPELAKTFEGAMETLPQAEKRKMFGYPAGFTNGYMFAGLHQDSFVLRLSDTDYAAFLRIKGAKAFEPMPGHQMSGFVVVPSQMLNSKELVTWLEKAFSNAKSLPPKETKTRRRA